MTNQIEQERISQVKEQHWAELMAKPNVVGVGIGIKETRGEKTGEMSMVVLVRQKIPLDGLQPEVAVPAVVGGVPTDVIEVGDLRALQARTDRWRPAPGGVSIGHYRITAGTLGCVVRDRSTGARLILSNNHVLANSNDASPGDLILQPGPTDGGQASANRIGVLERFEGVGGGDGHDAHARGVRRFDADQCILKNHAVFRGPSGPVRGAQEHFGEGHGEVERLQLPQRFQRAGSGR